MLVVAARQDSFGYLNSAPEQMCYAQSNLDRRHVKTLTDYAILCTYMWQEERRDISKNIYEFMKNPPKYAIVFVQFVQFIFFSSRALALSTYENVCKSVMSLDA